MAVDTRDKRASALLDGHVMPNPDASINAGDRLHLMLYRGIAAAAPVVNAFRFRKTLSALGSRTGVRQLHKGSG